MIVYLGMNEIELIQIKGVRDPPSKHNKNQKIESQLKFNIREKNNGKNVNCDIKGDWLAKKNLQKHPYDLGKTHIKKVCFLVV